MLNAIDITYVVVNLVSFLDSDYAFSTDEGIHALVSGLFPNASTSELDQLLELYPQDVTQGSPFDTGHQNALTPQYKRLASIQGDLLLIAPRRFFLQERSGKQPTWSYSEQRVFRFCGLSYNDELVRFEKNEVAPGPGFCKQPRTLFNLYVCL